MYFVASLTRWQFAIRGAHPAIVATVGSTLGIEICGDANDYKEKVGLVSQIKRPLRRDVQSHRELQRFPGWAVYREVQQLRCPLQ